MERYVPEELRIKMPWLLWQSRQDSPEVKATKLPIDPHTGRFASVSDSATWGAFELCYSIKHRATGLGIVLLKALGYTCIDLDETDDPVEQARHQAIIKAFNSYTEYSQSGKGYHIWVRGVIPSGRRRGKVEMYSDGRYMATTGNVFLNVPIRECQELCMGLWIEMEVKEKVTSDIDNPEIHTDNEVLTFASSAANAQKFIDLWEGRWQLYYEDDPSKVSCNEADFALINILAHYTQNRNQITRLFLSSALGKREKAKRAQYLGYMLQRCFDNRLPELNLDALHANLQQQLAAVKAESVQPPQLMQPPAVNSIEAPVQPQQPTTVKTSKNMNNHISKDSNMSNFEYTVPPGLCGEIAQFIYQCAPRPVKEIAIAGAIGLMSGVCGRAYNISGTGLNTYTFLLAKTGRGKEAMGRGINKLVACASKTVPAASSFIGPSRISSPQALVKFLSKTSNSFVSILGEFADTLKRMSNDSRNPIQQDVRIAMLDLYNKSGAGDVLGSLIYSDKDKNTDAFNSPAFSVIGEATPEKFYELLSKSMIDEGLLPRCTIIEYHGNRTQLNEYHDKAVPSQQLIDRFSALCAYALQLNNGNNVITVGMDKDAEKLINEFNIKCDNEVNKGDSIAGELWSRAHVKVLKLAASLAVGVNYIQPVINVECATWALQLITQDVLNLLGRFESGEIGVNNVQNDQATDIKKVIKKYVTGTWDDAKKYAGCSEALFVLKVIPHSYITACCRQRASFKNDKLGPVNAITNCVKSLIDCGEIVELSPLDKKSRNLTDRAKLYVISGMVL